MFKVKFLLVLLINFFLAPAWAIENLEKVYVTISSSCGFSKQLQPLINDAWELGKRGKYSDAQTKLDKVSSLTFNQACEEATYLLTQAMLFSKSGEHMSAIDILNDALARGLISNENIDDIELQVARLKVFEKNSGKKLNKTYRLTKKEKFLMNWDLFLKGEFSFAAKAESQGFFERLAASLPVMTGNTVVQAETLLNEKKWEQLAKHIIEERNEGLDIDFYYLAMAAKGMGLKKQSLQYGKKSLALTQGDPAKNCTRYQLQNGQNIYSYCANHKLPGDAQKLLSSFEHEEAQKARQLAENEAARKAAKEARRRLEQEKAAKQARITVLKEIYPDDSVEAILKGDVIKGMTKDAVKESKGLPDSIEVLGADEMWVYGTKNIIFSGDKVTFISR